MNKSEIRISLRRLVKERLYTVINVGGLAIGMAAALLIFLYLMFETSYDRHNRDHEHIYRIGTDLTISGERMMLAINSVPIGPLMVNQLPEITASLRVFPANYFFRNIIYRYGDKHFFEDGVFAVDSGMFDFFTCRFLHGRPEDALTEPFSIVMTESMAGRYFDDEPPVGKIIQLEGAGSFKVTAVIEDPPLNSHFQYTGLFSMSTMPHLDHLLEAGFMQGATWPALESSHGSRVVWVYVKTIDGFDPEFFSEHVWPAFYQDHIALHAGSGIDNSQLVFQPMADIHLHSKLPYEMSSGTGAVDIMSPELIRVFFLVAVFLLVLAAINYTNISISRFSRRSKEVGVKKVLGASRSRVAMQFFAESVIMTLAALFMSLLLVELVLPYVNDLLYVGLSVNVFSDPSLLLLLIATAIFAGLFAGVYPALYLSSQTPIQALAQRSKSGRKTLTLKKGLIILQFAISVFMVAATLVVNAQLRYIQTRNLGYDKDHVVIVELQDDSSRSRVDVIRNSLVQSPYIQKVAVSNFFPSILTMFNGLNIESETGFVNYSANVAQVHPDYLDFMGMEMVEGRFFRWDDQADYHQAVVINETAKRFFGWEEAIGKEITSGFIWPDGTLSEGRKVIGVLRDFHYASLVKPIEPMVWYPLRNTGSYLHVRINAGQFQEGLHAIEEIWDAFSPNNPFVYHILDQVIASMYESQRVLGVFFAAFAWICIIIAFLGLYGLSAYAVEQRTREIGIRKVLGARFADVMRILGYEFFWLILIASLVASSLAWIFMRRWLAGFAYHVELGLTPMIAASAASFVIAALAVGYHAWKATRMKTTESIKYE